MNRFGTALALMSLAALAVSCDSGNARSDTTTSKKGVWYGFIFNAKTGEKVNFFDSASSTSNDIDDIRSADQIWVMVDGDIRSAQPCGTQAKEINLQAGCFKVTDLPTGVKLPVFVTHSSYHAFAGTIEINPLVANVSDDNYDLTGPIFAGQPQFYGNVRIFPIGIDYDQTILVTYNNNPMEGLEVRCVVCGASGAGMFDILGAAPVGHFIDPIGDFNSIVSGVTDGEGVVTLPGLRLVKGAAYACFANGDANPIDGDVFTYSTTCAAPNFTAGHSDDTVKLAVTSQGNNTLFALFSNIDDPEEPIGTTGPVTIVLNRPATIYTGTRNCQGGGVAALIHDGTPPALVADVDDTDSESVTVSMDEAETTITITPQFETPISDDRFVDFSFGGIYLVPASGLNTGTIFRIGAPPAATGGFSLQTFTVPNTCGDFDALTNVEDLGNFRTGAAQGTSGRLVN